MYCVIYLWWYQVEFCSIVDFFIQIPASSEALVLHLGMDMLGWSFGSGCLQKAHRRILSFELGLHESRLGQLQKQVQN